MDAVNESFLSQLASLSQDNERMVIALESIQTWCRAYPATVFIEPDYEVARRALAQAGISMDALYGSWGRHILSRITKYVDKGLDGC